MTSTDSKLSKALIGFNKSQSKPSLNSIYTIVPCTKYLFFGNLQLNCSTIEYAGLPKRNNQF